MRRTLGPILEKIATRGLRERDPKHVVPPAQQTPFAPLPSERRPQARADSPSLLRQRKRKAQRLARRNNRRAR